MKRLFFEVIDSTNTFADANAMSLPSPTLIHAREQTAGRGQRGNIWVSEPGSNLTFTFAFRPESFPVNRQFYISEAFALAIANTLRDFCGIDASIKWPNDIFVDNRKICGILIKHGISGNTIMYTIAGAGININQTDLPVPEAPIAISAKQITGRHYDLDSLLDEFEKAFLTEMQPFINGLEPDEFDNLCLSLHKRYMKLLWRNDGAPHSFADSASGNIFQAIIRGVGPMGHLELETLPSHEIRHCAFKEISFE